MRFKCKNMRLIRCLSLVAVLFAVAMSITNCKKDNSPSVIETDVICYADVGNRNATFQCRVAGAALVEKVELLYSTSKNLDNCITVVMEKEGDDCFSVNVFNLICNTSYYYTFKFYNKYSDSDFDKKYSFKTNGSGLPEVVTDKIDNISGNQAEIHSHLVSDGCLNVNEYGIMYSTGSDLTNANTLRYKSIEDESVYITQLYGNTKYYVRAFAENNKGLSYGDILTFITNTNYVESVTVGSVKFNMIYVQGGAFNMGCMAQSDDICDEDEFPKHNVELSSYYIGETEVTQELWYCVTGTKPAGTYEPRKPVNNVTYYDCMDFINKLNDITGVVFRLPTEAEWEYASRGGVKSKGYIYSGSNDLNEVGWYENNTQGFVKEVGLKKANELGLYDMSGNVWELCSDWYSSNYYSSSPYLNPTGPDTGSYKVTKGGCCVNPVGSCRHSYRNTIEVSSSATAIGLRLVREIVNYEK